MDNSVSKDDAFPEDNLAAMHKIATYCITIIVTVTVLIVTYFKWSYRYWWRRNLPFLQPSIPFGNSQNPVKRTIPIAQSMEKYHQSLKVRGHKHGGVYIFTLPVYLPVDPEYIKNILSRDFQHFVDRGGYYNEKSDPLSAHLLNIEGMKWRNLRNKLTPTFTSGKMRMMFQTLVDCGIPMIEHINNLEQKGEALDVKDVSSSFTTDVIGSCAFGIECNSFTDQDSEFIRFGRKIFKPTKLQALKQFASLSFPKVCKFFNMAITPKNLTKFYMDVVRQTIEYREKNQVSRNDFMQLLLELKNNQNKGLGQLTLEEVSAQAFLFFLAGYETSSTTLTFCFLELAYHQDIQDKLREEVLRVLKKFNGEVTYEAVSEMKYMNQVIDETLRKYPPVVILTRNCVKDYPVPETDVVLEKGTLVFVPVYAVHHDPEIYPEPEKFDPERFSEEEKAKRHQFSYLPFGEGPRNCIGLRFGLMETKVGLALLLKNFKLTLNERTRYPIEFDINSFILSSKETILLDVEKIH